MRDSQNGLTKGCGTKQSRGGRLSVRTDQGIQDVVGTTTTTTKTLFSTQMEDYKRLVLRVIAGREHKLLRK